MSVTNVSTAYFNDTGRVTGCFVYMILCSDGGPIYVKVGVSQDPERRMLSIRGSCPVTPRKLAYTPTFSRKLALGIENALHKAFLPWRKHGEWFAFEPEDKALFNESWKEVFSKHKKKLHHDSWTQIDTKPLIMLAESRKKFTQRLWRKRGRAYQDFVRDCK